MGDESEWMVQIGIPNSAFNKATRYYYSETEPELNEDGTAYLGNYWKYDENDNPVILVYGNLQ